MPRSSSPLPFLAVAIVAILATRVTSQSICANGGANAVSVVGKYLAACFDEGNLALAAEYTTGPTFQMTWHGSKSLVPIAGTASGSNALQTFFGNVFSLVNPSTFHLNTAFAPPSQLPTGIRLVAVNCDVTSAFANVIVQWQEIGIVTATNKQFVNATNTVIYGASAQANGAFLVQNVDVWADYSVYADAFCAGSVTCSQT